MANLNVNIDTSKMRSNGEEIQKLTKELDMVFTALFDKIENIQNHSVWTGKSAEKFIAIAKADKKQYFDLKNELEKYGNFLCSSANKIENKMKGLNYL